MTEEQRTLADQLDDLRDALIGEQVSIHEAVKRFADITGDYHEARMLVQMILEEENLPCLP